MQIDYTAPPRGELPPETARSYLVAEYGHRCFRCGLEPSDERPRMDIDHIIPVARGGGNYYGNFQFLCGPCNSWKGTQIIDFRPGERRKIDAGLSIIPNEERIRKSPQKERFPIIVPLIQTVVERVDVPIMVPVPPPAHNCYDALPRLFGEYTHRVDEITRLTERACAAEKGAQLTDSYTGCIINAMAVVIVALVLLVIGVGVGWYIHA